MKTVTVVFGSIVVAGVGVQGAPFFGAPNDLSLSALVGRGLSADSHHPEGKLVHNVLEDDNPHDQKKEKDVHHEPHRAGNGSIQGKGQLLAVGMKMDMGMCANVVVNGVLTQDCSSGSRKHDGGKGQPHHHDEHGHHDDHHEEHSHKDQCQTAVVAMKVKMQAKIQALQSDNDHLRHDVSDYRRKLADYERRLALYDHDRDDKNQLIARHHRSSADDTEGIVWVEKHHRYNEHEGHHSEHGRSDVHHPDHERREAEHYGRYHEERREPQHHSAGEHRYHDDERHSGSHHSTSSVRAGGGIHIEVHESDSSGRHRSHDDYHHRDGQRDNHAFDNGRGQGLQRLYGSDGGKPRKSEENNIGKAFQREQEDRYYQKEDGDAEGLFSALRREGQFYGQELGKDGQHAREDLRKEGDFWSEGLRKDGDRVDSEAHSGGKKLDKGLRSDGTRLDKGLHKGAKNLDDGTHAALEDIDEDMHHDGKKVDYRLHDLGNGLAGAGNEGKKD